MATDEAVDVFEAGEEDEQNETQGGDTTLADTAREYAQARVDRLRLEGQAKKLKELEQDAQDRFLSLMATAGIDSLRITVEEQLEVSGRKPERIKVRYTLSPTRKVFARLKAGKDKVIKALKKSGRYAYLVHDDYTAQTLNSLMKEIQSDPHRELPPTLAAVMEPDETWGISMVKAAKS